jgi:hypothetical protein
MIDVRLREKKRVDVCQIARFAFRSCIELVQADEALDLLSALSTAV